MARELTWRTRRILRLFSEQHKLAVQALQHAVGFPRMMKSSMIGRKRFVISKFALKSCVRLFAGISYQARFSIP